MIEGMGIDIIEVNRIKKAIKKAGNRFLRRVFTEGEIKYCLNKRFPGMHFAGRFAAKEAIAKASGIGLWRDGFTWKDMDIVNKGNNSAVYVKISGRLQCKLKEKKVLISMSHCHDYAVANAVVYSEK